MQNNKLLPFYQKIGRCVIFVIFRETYVCVLTDGFTAFYAGLVVFTCMGFMAKESGLSVEEVAKSSGISCVVQSRPYWNN